HHHNRDLPSFPTRRSSDLDDGAREQIRQGVQQVDQRVADYNNIDFTIFRDMLPFMEWAPQPGPAARATATDRFFLAYVQRQVFEDRKSTRLNSSHRTISYA